MAKTPKDGQAHEFQLRPGVAPFGPAGWRGVNTESDPGSLDPNEIQRGDDIRIKGKSLITRPGLVQKLDLGQLAGQNQAVRWMHEAPVDNPRVRLWFSSIGCLGAGVPSGATVGHFDPTETPAFQVYGFFTAELDGQLVLAQYGDKLMVGNQSTLHEIIQIDVPPGISTLTVAGSPPQVPIRVFTGFTIRCMFEYDGKLFIGLEDNTTPTSSKIVVYNGASIADDLTGVRPPVAFGTWQNKLVCGFDETAANIRVRDPGAAPGTWVTFALAGYTTAEQGNAMQEVRGKLYIASGDDNIFSFNGTALALERTIVGAATDGFGVVGLTLHDGLLHYIWNTPGTAYNSRLGRHDPDSTASTEWLDTYKDITADIPNFQFANSSLSYRGQICCGSKQHTLAGTKIGDVQGTMETLNGAGGGGNSFQIVQLHRF